MAAPSLRIVVIGQSAFGAEVYRALRADGHTIVGVFGVEDAGGKPDALVAAASADGVNVTRVSTWRRSRTAGGGADPALLAAFTAVGGEGGTDLAVLAFCTQFVPMEFLATPRHGALIYHPSLLPAHRGASAINWTLMRGDTRTGFTIFWADDGLDTGDICLQRECEVRAAATTTRWPSCGSSDAVDTRRATTNVLVVCTIFMRAFVFRAPVCVGVCCMHQIRTAVPVSCQRLLLVCDVFYLRL